MQACPAASTGGACAAYTKSPNRGDDSRMTTATDTPRLLTVKEAARSLGISREAAYRLVRSGILPAYRVGPHGDTGPLRLDAAELDDWLESRRTTREPA